MAALDLSCSTRDLCGGVWDLSLWCAGFSLVVACRFSLSSCGVQALGRVGSLLRCAGISLVVACRFSLPSCGAQASGRVGSVGVAHGFQSAWAL